MPTSTNLILTFLSQQVYPIFYRLESEILFLIQDKLRESLQTFYIYQSFVLAVAKQEETKHKKNHIRTMKILETANELQLQRQYEEECGKK